MSALAGNYFEEYTISFKGDLMYLEGEDGSYGYYERVGGERTLDFGGVIEGSGHGVMVEEQYVAEPEAELETESEEESEAEPKEFSYLPDWYQYGAVVVKDGTLCFARDEGHVSEYGSGEHYVPFVYVYEYDQNNELVRGRLFDYYESEEEAEYYVAQGVEEEGEESLSNIGNVVETRYTYESVVNKFGGDTLEDAIEYFEEYDWEIIYLD